MIESGVVSSVPPDFLTLEEAAAVLRVGRSTAYREANAFEASGGKPGIPVIRYGKLFRVPRCRLEEQLGGPIVVTRSSMSRSAVDHVVRRAHPRSMRIESSMAVTSARAAADASGTGLELMTTTVPSMSRTHKVSIWPGS